MNRLLTVLVLLVVLIACNESKNEEFVPYVIYSKSKKLEKDLNQPDIPPPPKVFYTASQLIIDEKDNYYFYQRLNPWICMTTPHDSIPDFINLNPLDIVKIPKASLENFLRGNIGSRDEYNRQLIIGSMNDTLKNSAFLSIINRLAKAKKISCFSIRRTTQEEDTVLKYKKSNAYYSSDDILWDTARIYFDNNSRIPKQKNN